MLSGRLATQGSQATKNQGSNLKRPVPLVIRGKTSIGRATCDRLDLNDQEHNEGAIVKARRFWIQGGWHPPSDDTIEV